jgi:hypothetical protein
VDLLRRCHGCIDCHASNQTRPSSPLQGNNLFSTSSTIDVQQLHISEIFYKYQMSSFATPIDLTYNVVV